MYAYNLSMLSTSDIRWLEEHLVFESYQEQFFHKLYAMLIYDSENPVYLEKIWQIGVQLNKIYSLLTTLHQKEIEAINNMTSRSFLDGVQGYEFNSYQ